MPYTPEQFKNVRAYDCENEVQYVTSLASRVFGGGEAAEAHSGLDPQRLFDVARLNKMLAFLPAHPEALPPGCAGLAPKVDQVRLRILALNRRGIVSGAAVSRCLARAEIPHVHFKGPLQQIALYGSYLQKPSGDIDILVPPAHRKQAAEMLRELGYDETERAMSLWWTRFLSEIHLRDPESGIVVDLHHGLQQAGLPRPYNLEGFLQRRSELVFDEMTFQVPSPLDRCLLAAISISKALLAREPALSNVTDMRAALHSLTPADHTALAGHAAQNGMAGTLALAMRAVHSVFPELARTPALSQAIFPEISEADLCRMVSTPWIEGLCWPRRRHFLKALCGPGLPRFLRESLRAGLSELSHKAISSWNAGAFRQQESKP